MIINAQWQVKASGFLTSRNLVELIAVGDKVAWGVAGEAFDPIWEVPPFNDFTRTTDGGNHWIPGKVTAFPDYILVGIAPLSATLCYGSLANFNTGNTKVVKTTDGGITWVEQFNYDFGATFAFFADIYFFNANDGLIYGDPSDGYFTIFTTNDGGAHWARVPEANMPAALTDEFSYVFSSEGIGDTFWTVSTSGRIWKTTDKGLQWNAYTTEQTSIEFSNLKMRDALHGLWGVHGELYRTSDGGNTWQEVEFSGNWFTNDLAYVPGTVPTYVSTGSHDMPGYAENGSLHGIGTSYSVDDGNTWITIDTAVEHFCLAMVNSYTGFTGGINTSKSRGGIFTYIGPAMGYPCGNNGTILCHNGHEICVENSSISNHILHGDVLGKCTPGLGSKASSPGKLLPATGMSVFPNPVRNILNIYTSSKAFVSLTDQSGKKIFSKVIDSNDAIDVSKVPAGVYFVKNNTTGETMKIVIGK